MAADKSKNDEGGFFGNEADEDYLSENTVVDTEVLKKLNEKITDDPDDEVELEVGNPEEDSPEYEMPAPSSTPPVPPVAKSVPESKKLSEQDKVKVEQVHDLFEDQEEELDQTMAEEKTIILPDDEVSGVPESEGAKLVIVEGPQKDKEYLIEYNEVFIGRGTENDFVISDRSISRKHFRIRRRFDEYILVDLQSGNGTKVNGKKVSELVLNSDDEISIGKTKMKFVDLAAAAIPAKAAVVAVPTEDKAAKAAPKSEPKAAAATKTEDRQESSNKEQPVQDRPGRDRPSRDRLKPISAQRPADTSVEEEKQGGFGGLFIGMIIVIAIIAVYMFIQYQEQLEDRPEIAKTVEQVKPVVKPAEKPVAKPEIKEPSPEEKKAAELKNMMDEADQLVANKFFAKAAKKYEEILVLAPTNQKAKTEKDKALQESANRQTLDDGKKLIEQKQNQKAAIRLKLVSMESVFYPEAQALIRGMDQSKIDADIANGKALLDGKKYDKAIVAFNAILASNPTNAQAQKYKQIAISEKNAEAKRLEASKLQAEQNRVKAAEARKAKEAERKTKLANDKKREQEALKRRQAEAKRKSIAAKEAKKRLVNGSADLNVGLSLYKKGKLESAISELQSISNGRGHRKTIAKAASLIKKIKKFRTDYKKGMSAHRGKDAKTGIVKLKSAMKLDRSISSDSKYAKELPQKIADMYYLVGNNLKKSKSYQKAFKAYKKALAFYPSHTNAKKGLKDIAKVAKKLYYQGYAIKDNDPDQAEKYWNTVLKIVPSSNEWYKKSKNSLEDL